MKLRILNLLTLLLVLTISTYSQDVASKEDKIEKENELKEKAVVLLRETTAEIATLRSIENRISFTSETSGLIWYFDADEGRRMFGELTDNFVQLMSQYNTAVNSFGGVKDESEFYRSRSSPTEKNKAIRRLYKAMSVRQQIALTIAAHDAELSLDFLDRTLQTVTAKTFRKNMEQQDGRIESRIITMLSGQDIDKALAIGRRSLKKKFRSSLLSLLTKVHKKDKDKGNDFADDIMDKVKSQTKEPKSNLYNTSAVLDFGKSNLLQIKGSNASPIFPRKDLKELADVFANALMSREEYAENYSLKSFYRNINHFSPASAQRLKAKYKDSLAGVSNGDKAMDKMREGAADVAKEAAMRVVDSPSTPEQLAAMKLQEDKQKLFETLQDPDSKIVSDEEKAKVIGEARRIISTLDNPMEKMVALSGLALKVKQLGDQELASEIMDEANVLVNPQPKSYIDFMQIWMLANGYSAVDPEKAFPLLEDAVYQLNDTISAFVKVGEFIDIAGDIIVDDEVQIGSFGDAITRDLLRSLQNSDVIMKNLAEADFDRTKGLADRFNRTEVRILAKMMILRSILGEKSKKVTSTTSTMLLNNN